jgi:hypothetical protein
MRVGAGIARGDSERERIVMQRRSRVCEVAANLAERRRAGQGSGELQETAAVHRPRQGSLERFERIGHRGCRSPSIAKLLADPQPGRRIREAFNSTR